MISIRLDRDLIEHFRARGAGWQREINDTLRKATRLRRAISDTLNIDKVRTGDLGGTANTAAFAKALVSRIANG